MRVLLARLYCLIAGHDFYWSPDLSTGGLRCRRCRLGQQDRDD